MNILGIAGSLRAGSLNRRLLEAAGESLPAAARLSVAEIRDLPLYDADLDGEDKPSAVQTFIDAVGHADAVLIATPEYNYGIPGPLKNALDWASRPAYRSVFAGRPTAIISASGSAVGGARAQGQLKQVLLGMVTPIFPHPEFVVGAARSKFDEAGRLVDEDTRHRLTEMMAAFVRWAGSVS